ncbi:NAD(P)-dependent oxidoreductase [Roseibacterium sp. SDUM158017]|uniref:NAD(P)-dependent oxidoreductase n=1 Tax=Roseicyclus salinarum TaxID=3036773 RepID=UPI0024150153|nr:NAD(P)-dependent oxidoreductase [Roseibacterium sp. SDUM158017]MDG4649280.1 NAD(P)-dependent oxidoreductase [Roseibacterium sp. SDUM158017]
MAAEQIGIIGTGRMGTAFATRLVGLGHDVRVWNRTPDRTTRAAEAGASHASTLAELVGASDIVISSLTDKAAIDGVLDGPDGLLAAGMKGKLWIEMSTLLPDQQQALEAKAVAVGGDYLECPVGGTVGPALKGALLGMAGGSQSAWERGKTVLEGLCKRVEHLGPVGSGSAMKLAVNLPLALYWASMGEALSVLKGSGVPPGVAASIMSDSSAGPAVLKNRLDVVVKTLEGEDQPGTFDINGLRKDLLLALEWASRAGADMTLSTAARDLYEAAVAEGLGGCDGSSLTRLMLAD